VTVLVVWVLSCDGAGIASLHEDEPLAARPSSLWVRWPGEACAQVPVGSTGQLFWANVAGTRQLLDSHVRVRSIADGWIELETPEVVPPGGTALPVIEVEALPARCLQIELRAVPGVADGWDRYLVPDGSVRLVPSPSTTGTTPAAAP
jgi:hypothetical protein